MHSPNPSVAIVTFTDDRDVGVSSEKVEKHLRNKQEEIKRFLNDHQVTVYDPLHELKQGEAIWYGIRNLKDIDNVIALLANHQIDAGVIGAWTWSPPMLVMEFLRKFAKPIVYYTENDPMAGSLSQFTATCSSLMEWGVNRHALSHERNFGNKDSMLRWIRGISAASRMRERALLLWGGTYAVKMEQLQDDIPRLKSFFVREVLQEDQYVLVNRAEKIRKYQKERIKKLLLWLKNNGLHLCYDASMLTRESFQRQLALLLAARDRLGELKDENIGGVSIKCQPEIYSEYGVDACTLPALLPFAQNEEGEQVIYPTVCEGDIKGLLTSMLLHALNPAVPPAFGDLISVGDDHIEFANCGAGSLFWAANSLQANQVLKKVTASGNIHGVSGAAFSYYGVAAPDVTVARLTRIRGNYYMQLGHGRALDSKTFLTAKLGKDVEQHLGARWGKIVVDLKVKGENFVKVAGANHLNATLGDYTEEMESACRELGIRVVRIDSDEEMRRFYNVVRGQDSWRD